MHRKLQIIYNFTSICIQFYIVKLMREDVDVVTALHIIHDHKRQYSNINENETERSLQQP